MRSRIPQITLRNVPMALLGVVVSFLLGSSAWGQGVGYDAVLSSPAIPKGESTVLQLRYVNCEPTQLPEIPEIDGLSVSYKGPSRNSSFQFVNGRQTSTITLIHQFAVTPQREGTFVIPPIESTINGKKYNSKGLRLTVSKGLDYSQYAFIRVTLPKQTVYVGELFQMFVDLYEVNAKIEEKPVIPTDGFVIAEAGQPSQTQTRLGNQIYNRIRFQYTVRAVKTGELNIGPVTWNVPLFFRNNNGRSQRRPFGSFFRDLVDLNSTVRRDVKLESESVSLQVKALPETNRPSEFNGAVGNFTMNVSASPTELTAGDPITVKMTIDGRGALEALRMPSFESWREFKQYQETSQVGYSDKMGLSGTKTFEKVVIPNNAEITSLPEIKFSFFDPMEEKYKTLLHPPTPLIVKPNLSAASAPTVIADGSNFAAPVNIATNIVHIKPRLGTLASASPPWLTQPSFLWAQLIPLVGFVGATIYRVQAKARNRNPRAQRRRRVRSLVSTGLKDLKSLANENQPEEFFALLFRLLQEQIGERLNLPANAITESVIDNNLRGQLPEEHLITLERLFHTCNQSRYAPVGSPSELNQIANEAEQILTELQALPETVSQK